MDVPRGGPSAPQPDGLAAVIRRVRPSDVVALTDLLIGAVRSAGECDWSVRAGTLDWDVETTIEHVAASMGKYTLYLASAASRSIPLRLNRMDDEVTHEDWLAGLAAAELTGAPGSGGPGPGT